VIDPTRYQVLVDDNFHFMDERERYESGLFESYAAAVEKCKTIVERCLTQYVKPGMDSDQLYRMYQEFGEDPWISPTPDGVALFSAWDYARTRSREIAMSTKEDSLELSRRLTGGTP
jgi:hypothetical protein